MTEKTQHVKARVQSSSALQCGGAFEAKDHQMLQNILNIVKAVGHPLSQENKDIVFSPLHSIKEMYLRVDADGEG
jgi:hypothetical protein